MDEDDEDYKYEKPQIFVDRLVKLYYKGIISERQIRDHINLIIFGGHDTSGYTLAMTILMLAMHPDVDKRVLDELNEVLGDYPIDTDLTMEQINKLVYLEQVIKETLRMHPVGPVLMRYCSEDTPIRDTIIPAGTEVVLSVMTLHRRKDIWGEDANEFNPDHFSKEQMATRNPYAYMAFSHGNRNCIGQRFAYNSIKVSLAKLLRKYRFSTQIKMDEIKFSLEVTAKPANGIFVQVEERI